MPVFEYHCNKCKIKFETLVLDSREIVKCLSCDSPDIQKMFSLFGSNTKKNTNLIENTDNLNNCCNTACRCHN